MFLASKAWMHRGVCLGCCFVVLLAACRSTEINQDSITASETPLEESNMTKTTPGSTESQTYKTDSTSEGSTPEVEGDGTVSIESSVELPAFEPLNLPYSEWGAHRSQELLTANGFGATANEWRRAADHSSGLVREAAIYLLVGQLQPGDEVVFRKGLEDIDESVQALSAYGLIRLGDDSAKSTLQQIAQQDPDVFLSAPLAASLLAELGDPSAFDTMVLAMTNQYGYVRLIAMQYMPSFIPLHGQATPSGQEVDVWFLYCQALGDEDGQVSAVAQMQLEELDSPEAIAVLRDCSVP